MNFGMPVEQMIEHIRAGGYAKRRHWNGARVQWHEKFGPHRGDLNVHINLSRTDMTGRYNNTLYCEDWIAEDWVKCDQYGREIKD